MGETSCVVFIEDEAYIFQGEGKLFLPVEMVGYPMMLSNDNGTKVMMNSGITNPIGRAAMRSSILGMIEEFRKVGIPRIEFPRWNEMLIYPVEPEGADVEYWCPEQVVDSFLDLYGAEFII